MKNIQIKNFKSLKDFEISDLKRVNLFTGRNNTGKSTLLEAISISATNGNLYWIYNLLDLRGEISKSSASHSKIEKNIELFSSLFNGYETDFSQKELISIFAPNDGSIKIGFVKYTEGKVFQDIDGEKIQIGTKKVLVRDENTSNVKYGLMIKNTQTSTIISLEEELFSKFIDNQSTKKFNYIDTKGKNYIDTAILWDKITLTDKEKNVIDAIQLIDSSIERLSYIGENSKNGHRYPVVKTKDNDKKFPIGSMGEGINRIMNVILAIVNSENGYLLIDEFENGLHYSIQQKLWEIIFETAEKLNVQIFATTHSTDTINSFAKVLDSNESYSGSLYRMAQVKDNIKAYSFTKEEIIRAADQDLNLR